MIRVLPFFICRMVYNTEKAKAGKDCFYGYQREETYQ